MQTTHRVILSLTLTGTLGGLGCGDTHHHIHKAAEPGDSSSGDTMAVATATYVMVNLETRKLQRPPKELVASYGRYEADRRWRDRCK